MIDQNMHALVSNLFGRRHVVHVETRDKGEAADWTCFDCGLISPVYASLEVCERDADSHAADPGSHPMEPLGSDAA